MTAERTGILALRDVVKEYPVDHSRKVTVIHGISLEVYPQETLGLIGESGCGKTTTGNMIAHLLNVTSGEIYYGGRQISSMTEKEFRPFRHQIQMIFQDPYSSLNASKKIGWLLDEALYLRNRTLSQQDRKQRVIEILDEVGMEESYRDRYPYELSGGQRQRISIALALITDPEFIVCDEPVSALDVSIQAQILNLLKDLQKKHGLTYLFISHDLNVVSYLADRIAVMYLGRIVEIGTTEEILEHACHPYTECLFSAIRKGRKPETMADAGSIMHPAEGCPFAARCPNCTQVCLERMPKMTQVTMTHSFACFFPEGGK
ncbi:MAG: ABC transporter ATP-binding protein [Solobacterium sp.]|nr:ABC transporter ATP-binding protein [Solobacterium sp.]